MSRYSALEQEAASWLARRQEAEWSDDDQAELDEWLDASLDHAAAYWRLEYGYAQFDRLHSLPEAPPEASPGRVRPRFFAAARMTALAATLAVIVIGGVTLYRDRLLAPSEITTFTTQPGQVAKVELGDGTLLSLDTASRVRIASDRSQRKILLDRGNIYLEVAHDPARPFVVQAGIGRVTVLGTKFSVARQSEAISVAVLEGRVRLDPLRRKQANFSTVSAGEFGLTDGGTVSVSNRGVAAIAQSLAWREGKVVFNDTRIADAAMQFNRYNDRKLLVADNGAGDVRIGGTFRLGNVDGFTNILKDNYGIKVSYSNNNVILSSKES